MAFVCATVSLPAQKKPDPRPPLLIAIERQNVAAAQSAIQQGADVNAIYEEETMLLRAIREGKQEITKLILQAPGIDVNKRGVYVTDTDDWNRTPLIQAAHMGNAEIVSILLKMGAKVNARDSNQDHWIESRGYTALHRAAMRDHTEVIRVLVTEAKGLDLELTDRTGLTALWDVSLNENLTAVKLLHDHGAKITTTDADGNSILTTTCEHKKREVLDYLIANGADINHLSNQGSTPLISAIVAPDSKLVRTYYNFIDYFQSTYKPKLDLQEIKRIPGGAAGGDAALHEAALFGNVDVIALLLDRGATLELKSLASGGTALHYAVMHKKLEAARLLIKRKANIEARDAMGETPLIHAAYNSDPAMVQLLVDSGAAINVRSLSNVMVTPLVHAATEPNFLNKKDNLAIFNILLSAKGDIDFKSSDGTTALMAAARQSNTGQGYELAAFFIGKGANLDLKNNKGETALMLAAGAGNEKLVQLLMDKGADAKIKNGAGETVMSYANRATSKGSTALLESQGVQPEAPIVHKSVIVDALLGTWTGAADGLPQAVYTVVLNRNGTYDFNSKLTAAAMKYIPKGSMKATIAAHHGTYSINGDTMIWNPVGTAPTSMQWKLDKGMLILDNRIRLKKAGATAK